MILILADTKQMAARMSYLVNALSASGENVLVESIQDLAEHSHNDPTRGTWPRRYESGSLCAGMEQWFLEGLFGYLTRSGVARGEEYFRTALLAVDCLARLVEMDHPEFVIVWGGSNIYSRSAILACKQLEVPVISLETPVLPTQSGHPSDWWFFSYMWPYYEDFSCGDWANWAIDGEALDGYKLWWKASKQTKALHKVAVRDIPLPVTWDSTSRVVLFDQIQSDCANIWQGARVPEMLQDCLTAGAWVKTHPLDPRGPCMDRYGLPSLDPTGQMSIHSVLPHLETVVTVNSNVGLEAWFYDKDVVCYGTPFYNFDGLVRRKMALAEPVSPELRDSFLWYLLSVHHANGANAANRMRDLIGVLH